jgi:outer membrane receptor protein involved in Fe transport
MTTRTLRFLPSAIGRKLLFSVLCFLSTGLVASAAPATFAIPEQPMADALDLFIKQAGVQVVYRQDDVRDARANAVNGKLEPREALQMLIKDTGLRSSEPTPGQFTVGRPAPAAAPVVTGTVINEETGKPVAGAKVRVVDSAAAALTDHSGRFRLEGVPSGIQSVVIMADDYAPTRVTEVNARAGAVATVGEVILKPRKEGVTKLEEYVVSAQKDVVELEGLEVSSGKVKPFVTRNADIPRGINDVQPYYIFDAKQIEHSGALNVENFILRKLTMTSNSSSADQGIFIGGLATGGGINLRGLGSNQTLILVNGRRFSSGGNVQFSGIQQSINSIPLGSIERVEMLPTSAGAIYGSNAVGGVINIILKRNYTGGEVRMSYQNPFDTDAPIRQADVNYGFSLEGGRTQIMLTAGYSDQEPLLYQDRPILKVYDARSVANGGTDPVLAGVPNIVGTTNLVLKPAWGGTALGSTRTYVSLGITPATSPQALGAALVANAGKWADPFQIPASTSRGFGGGALSSLGVAPTLNSFGATLRRQMTAKLDLNAEFSVSRTETYRFGPLLGSRSLAASSPFNPFTTAVSVYLPVLGGQPNPTNSYTRRAAVGMIYDLPRDWKLQADYTWTYGTNYLKTVGGGGTFSSAFGVTYNPFVDTTAYPLNLDQYGTFTQISRGGGGTNDVALRGSGPIWALPAGDPLLTFGLENRKEGYGDADTDNTVTDGAGNILSTSSASTVLGKSQTTRSAYLELQAPIFSEKNALPWIRELNLQIAGRREDFVVHTGTNSITRLPVPATPPVILNNTANFSSTNPTVGFSYKPIKDVMIRVSYGKGFLAPSYSQLMLVTTPNTFASTIVDRKRGNASYGVFTTGGGNPDLVPETSTSWNAGIVYQPQAGVLKGLRANLEYFLIRKQNNIGSLSAQQIIDAEAAYPQRIDRAAPATGDPFGVGTITTVRTAPFNLLRSLNEGFDLNLAYRHDTAQFGSFDFSALATYNVHASRKNSVTTPNLDFVSVTGVSGSVLRFQANASLAWDYRNWTVGWTTRYVPRLRIFGPPFTTSTVRIQEQGGEWVPSQMYSDAFVTYRFDGHNQGTVGQRLKRYTRGLELEVGVSNVFDKIPPYDVGAGAYRYSTFGNIRLREYRLSLKKAL